MAVRLDSPLVGSAGLNLRSQRAGWAGFLELEEGTSLPWIDLVPPHDSRAGTNGLTRANACRIVKLTENPGLPLAEFAFCFIFYS